MKTVADLMTPAPSPWGLRGDPILWRMMMDELIDVPLPEDQEALQQIIKSTFQELTKHNLDNAPDHLQVAETYRENGGMSRGMVSGLFWRDTALPLLVSRWKATRM